MTWKIISGALAAMGIGVALWLIHEIHSGVVHTRSGSIVRAENPEGFWSTVVIDAAIIIGFFFASYRSYLQGRREPNF